MIPSKSSYKFSLGITTATAKVLDTIPRKEIIQALARHLSGDWGEISDDDFSENIAGLSFGERLISAYKSSNGIVFWVISELRRKRTTVLLPSEF